MKSMTRNTLILGLGLMLGVMLAVGQGVLAEKRSSQSSAESIHDSSISPAVFSTLS